MRGAKAVKGPVDNLVKSGDQPLPPKLPQTLKVILRIFFAIGGALVVTALILTAREWRFIASSEHAAATVSRIDREWMSGVTRTGGGSSGGNWGYRIVATFPAADGRTIEVRSASLTSFTGYHVGDTIGVDYPAGRPEQAQLVRFVDRWLLQLVLGGIGAVALAICGFAVWLLRQPGTRITSNGIGGFSIQPKPISIESDRPRPAAPDASKAAESPSETTVVGRRGWLWVALVLLAGIGIGLAVAHFGAGAPSSNARWAAATVPPPSDTGDGPPAPGYPPNLTVKVPAMSDSADSSSMPNWADPANGGATPANLTMAARAFLARPERDAAMRAALRNQVARLGLNCPAISFTPGDTLLMAAPTPLFDAGGAMQRGLIRQRFLARECPGRSAEFNIWVFAPGDGASIRTVAGFPGTTRANPTLLQDATPIVMGIAGKLAPGCRTLMVSDTHLPLSPRDAASPWQEQWLVIGCGNRIALTVNFIPDATRGTTRIEVPDTMARLLAPQ